jgi:plastocyanin
MPTWRISIDPNPAGPTSVKFTPDPRPLKTLDLVFWVNNDPRQPHWPGLLKDDGTIDTTFFIPNQIAPNGDVSATFAAAQPFTYNYICSIPGHANEKGTIVVTDP